jgi:hypothetical protein
VIYKDSKLQRLNDELVKIDQHLYADRDTNGATHFYRRHRFGTGSEYIMSSTHDWTVRGTPVDRGIVAIIDRLNEIDAWKNQALLEQRRKDNEKVDEIKQKDFDNSVQDFCRYELHPVIKKEYSNVNTSLMNKRKGRYFNV